LIRRGQLLIALGATLGPAPATGMQAIASFARRADLTSLLVSCRCGGPVSPLRGQIAGLRRRHERLPPATALFSWSISRSGSGRMGDRNLANTGWPPSACRSEAHKRNGREAPWRFPTTVFTLGLGRLPKSQLFVKARRGGFRLCHVNRLPRDPFGYTQYSNCWAANAAGSLFGGYRLVGLAVAGARFFRRVRPSRPALDYSASKAPHGTARHGHKEHAVDQRISRKAIGPLSAAPSIAPVHRLGRASSARESAASRKVDVGIQPPARCRANCAQRPE